MFLTKRLFLGALALSLMSWASYSSKSLANPQLSTKSLQEFTTASLVPQGGSQKSKVKSQNQLSEAFLAIGILFNF